WTLQRRTSARSSPEVRETPAQSSAQQAIDLPPPSSRRVAEDPRPAAADEPATNSGAAEEEPPRPPWYGRIVDAETRAPVADATCELSDGAPLVDGVVETAPPHADGLVELHLASGVGAVVFVQSPGYGLSLVAPEPGHERADEPEEVELQRSASVRVHLHD